MRSILFFLLFFLSCQSGISQVDLSTGLIAYYPFNGNANDLSGNNNNPIFNNATLTTGRMGIPNTAYYFDGATSYMRIANNTLLNPTQLTLFALVKPMGFYHGLCYNNSILDKGALDQNGNYSLRFTAGSYTNSCNIDDSLHQNFLGYGAGPSASLYTPYVQKDIWYCVVYTISADSIKLYINGTLKQRSKITNPVTSNSDDISIGKKLNNVYPYWYKGVIDEIRIYNRPLNAEEVNTLCNSFSESQGNVGIGTSNPTAKLHVDCWGALISETNSNIRFENLQQGPGSYLVIDANGYVHKSASASANRSIIQDSVIEALQEELKMVKQELADLKTQIKILIESNKINNPKTGIRINTNQK